jgi:hypothetical protein
MGGDEGEGDQCHPHPTSPIKGEVRRNAASFARGIYQMGGYEKMPYADEF